MPDIRVKICGVTRPQDLGAVAAAGGVYVGFNFFPKSPRYVSPETARVLSFEAPEGVAKVGLTVNASEAELDGIVESVPLDMLQLHGSESPDRIAEIRARYGLPVMKALGVASEEDLPALAEFSQVADQLLVDAKPPKGADLPGGNGLAFDWRLIAGRRWAVPWMLAGGLTPANVREAVHLTGANQVDVSSGVESAPGVKDPARIAAFVAAARE
ncbi:phosphoribosylanthranilate isomerase [Aliiruegeria haliotis]|uniref:N-(5'-phosphoribosyl)anthranilate isomerase n=1 Tax=Aliiruegeria haliotis TaxID=1280846 RepID=A0A2T0RW74_9RHOB|nr:phosphoribosylanthranilate isomerase [Aliiruegeria haliotis]PRY25408.1 phosphoribosylanthranilate isomerase [Aliiruegeria haliotis]